MGKKQLPPFVTPIEIIRTISSAFDFKSNDKTLDDMALKLDADYRYINKFIEDHIQQPFSKYISPKISNDIFIPYVEKVISNNFKNIKNLTGMGGLNRKHALPILVKYIFAKQAASFLWKLHREIQGPNPMELIAYNESSVSGVLSWLDAEEAGWKVYLNQLTKEKKEKILSWQRAEYIPSAQSLANLNYDIESSSETPVIWDKVKTLLFTARAIDKVKRNEYGELFIKEVFYALQPSYDSESINDVIDKTVNNLTESGWEIAEFVVAINKNGAIDSQHQKHQNSKREGRDALDKLRKLIDIKEDYINFEYFLNLFEARWHVLSGELDRACEFYKEAFQNALYRHPEILQDVIEEALVTAASLHGPDKTFLKRLKNISISYGYDISLIATEKKMITKKLDDVVEPWEVRIWKSGFSKIFPQKGFYPDAITQNKTDKSFRQSPDELRSVDLRNPDQEIKEKGRIAKSIPQIVYYSARAKVDEVKALLDKGADVNVFSDIGDTAILMALKAMIQKHENFALAGAGEKIFNLLVKHKHNPDILNTPSQITKTLPLNCAVETGRLDVVSKLLEMGVDPNARGTVDNISSLYFCINLIAKVKYIDEHINPLGQPPSSLEQHDVIRRYTAGAFGFTNRQQANSISDLLSSEESREIIDNSKSIMADFYKKYDITDLREIAKLLLSYGADKNLNHVKDGVSEYTPYKLAEEINELALFDLSAVH